MPPRAAQYPEQQAHSRIPMSVPDWRQPQGLRGRPGFKPTCRAEFAAWTASGRAGRGAGGRRQGLAGLRDDAPSERSATKHRRYGGSRRACGACLGSGGRRQGQGGPSGRAKLRPLWRPPQGLRGLASVPVGGGRARADYPTALSTVGMEAAAGPAGPGRASRRRAERSSRRGRRAGGQAPRRPEIRQCHKRNRRPAVPQAPPESQNSS